ncbi:MAG TPA: hypothetical protein VLX92_00725 [Kofleriaceae bacterium]|nr:hypothetical protein [Kofleriaceae bacterium]
MDHPYRVPPEPPELPGPRMPSEEVVLIGLLLVIGGVRVVVAIATGSAFDSETTLGLVMFGLGLWWGLSSFRRTIQR